MPNRIAQRLTLAAVSLSPALSLAHGELPHADFVDGFVHPFAGLDHLFAMIAVGLLAGRMANRRALLIPVSFVLAMVGGALVSLTGITLPATEIMIALSVVALGLAVIDPSRLQLVPATALVAFFALFHGYAHGLEAGASSFVQYTAGFTLATAALHAIGVGLYFSLRDSADRRQRALQVIGRCFMIAGVVIALRFL